jgi:hypothetical protein
MPILWDKNDQQLNDRIRSFTVLNWYCKTFLHEVHALLRDSDYRYIILYNLVLGMFWLKSEIY